MSLKDETTWLHIFMRIGLNTATHPFEYAKVLIQIGHEPLEPYKSKNIFKREQFYYPSVFSYIAHIKHNDGFFGCYRGLGPKIASNVLSGLAYQKIIDHINMPELNKEEVEEFDVSQKLQYSVQRTLIESVGRTGAIVVSQPLHVVTIRCMAQFVGGEEKYMGVSSSIGMIYKEEGLKGFFSGVVARIICDIGALWLGNCLIYAVNNYVIEDRELKSYTSASIRFLTSSVLYPFQVVANCMAVCGSGLVAASPPHMPAYSSWVDCFRHLERSHCLKRGSSVFWRAYTGPLMLTTDGSLAIPEGKMFKSE